MNIWFGGGGEEESDREDEENKVCVASGSDMIGSCQEPDWCDGMALGAGNCSEPFCCCVGESIWISQELRIRFESTDVNIGTII